MANSTADFSSGDVPFQPGNPLDQTEPMVSQKIQPEAWVRIHGLFERMLESEDAAVVLAGESDRAVAQAAERLYNHHRRAEAEQFLNDPITLVRDLHEGDAADGGEWEGKTFSHFRILRKLGQGGMGKVYLAEDLSLGRQVALKFLALPPHAWSQGNWDRFRREARAAAALKHPNICTIHGLEELDGQPVIEMEYAEGETLAARIARGPLPANEALTLTIQIAEGVAEAHRQGIVHRDLKPANIMLTRFGVKVLDFGLARIARAEADPDEASTLTTTSPGRIMGTPYYMSPEQSRGEAVDGRADIFSLGVVLYEITTGKRPFTGKSSAEILAAVLKENPVSPSQHCSNLPARLDEIVGKCLEKDPALRYQRAEEMRTACLGLQSELAAGPRDPSPAGLPGVRRHRARPLKAGALVTALLLIPFAFTFRAPSYQASMVVFQINDLVNDPAYRPLSAGLTGELVTRLAKMEGLSVKQYYGTREKANLSAIKDRFFLDGDLQKFQNRIRLTMRLADTRRNGAVVWSNSFDRDLDNPLELESEIAQRVVDGLQDRVLADIPRAVRLQFAGYQMMHSLASVLPAPQPQVAATSPAAYQAYLRGRELLDERNPSSVRAAIESLGQAVHKDPNFALAYAALSDAYRGVIDGRQAPQLETLEKSLNFAEKAVQLNPQLPEGYAALAAVQQMQWDWPGSRRSYLEAIRLDPKSPVAYRRYGGLLLQFGDFDGALAFTRKGLELDPYDYPGQAAYGFCLRMARRYAEAETQLKWTLEQRDFIMAHNSLGEVYSLRGQQATGDEAARYFDLALEETRAVHKFEVKGTSNPETFPTPVSDAMFALFYARRGDRLASQGYLERLKARLEVDRVSPASLAAIYAALGDEETAIDYLERAERIKDRGLLYLKVDPSWDPIRHTDEYKKVLLTMGL
jgi:serine/threonine-protein kinase